MEVDVKAGRFLEHGEYDGNLYGTKIESIHEVVATGRTCILDVNPQVKTGLKFIQERIFSNVSTYVWLMQLFFFSPGSEGSENSRVHALRGVHCSARFWYTQRHAQSCGGRRHHNQAAHGRWTPTPPEKKEQHYTFRPFIFKAHCQYTTSTQHLDSKSYVRKSSKSLHKYQNFRQSGPLTCLFQDIASIKYL